MQRFFDALRARKIDRAAAVYAVAGWALVQAAAIVLPAFEAPPWTLRVFIALVIVGFPVTLALIWTTAPHPHRSKGHTPPAAHHTDVAILVTLAVVLVGIVAQTVFVFERTPPTGAGHSIAAKPALAAQPHAVTSIAVLPFASMSGDPSNRYFSDGISSELIAELSHVPDLKVAARASSFSFEGKNADIKTIARALGVSSVLDGSVRVEGTSVRIEAELSSDDGFTIWSQTYDGDLTHILQLQDDIARAITETLTHRLLGKYEVAAGRPTSIDPEAYREYLEGRYDYAQRNEASVIKAIALFKHVTQLQPDFAAGFAALAGAESSSAFDFGHRENIEPAEAAIQEALRLDPGNVEVLISESALSLSRWDWGSAEQNLRKLRALPASSSATLKEEALLLKILGFPQQALEAAQESAKLDPLYPIAWANIASNLFELGHYREAGAAAANGLALLPAQPDMLVEQCGAYAHTGQSKDAQLIADGLTRSGDIKHADGCLYEIALAAGQLGDARKIADRIARASDVGASRLRETLGQYFLLLGDTKTAMTFFEQAYRTKELGLFTVRWDHSTPSSLLADPGWTTLWQKPLMKQWQAAHDRIAAEISSG